MDKDMETKELETFEDRRIDWEKRVEDIVIEIINEKTKEGLAFNIDVLPLIKEFNLLMSNVATYRKLKTYYFKPGDKT